MRPSPPPPPEARRVERPLTTVAVESITRLFGGGVKARTVDARCWLRSSAAKSALRAWWRAGNAHRFGTLGELRAREGGLFGAPATCDESGAVLGGPGAVAVAATSLKTLPLTPYQAAQGSALNVAYFAAAAMGARAAHLMPAGARAEVRLRFREADAAAQGEVLDALRLWLVLGGAGARTRRGSGALALPSPAAAQELGIPASLEDLQRFLQEHCRRQEALPADPALHGVFRLARTRSIFLGPAAASGEEAQRTLLAALREARQDRPHPASWQGAAGWGRSRWPEADAIRIKAGGGFRHSPAPAHADSYPRAALGLPIVVHFQPPAEPRNHQILAAVPGDGGWVKLERYLSPLLLRPVRVWRHGRAEYVPVAIFTDCTLPREARPFVAGNGAAGTSVDPRDVAASYEIQAHADATLTRVERTFAKARFRQLKEAR